MNDTSISDYLLRKREPPVQSELNGQPFPHARKVKASYLEETLDSPQDHADALKKETSRSGVLLLHGLPPTTPEDFDEAVTAFCLSHFPYEISLSNAVRVAYTPGVFSAKEAPTKTTILQHHENARTPVYLTTLKNKGGKKRGEQPEK